MEALCTGRLAAHNGVAAMHAVKRNCLARESSVSDYFLLFFLFLRGRPPFLPFFLAALALAADRARPPFIPPLLPQFLNISITALGSSARSLLLWRLAIPSEF